MSSVELKENYVVLMLKVESQGTETGYGFKYSFEGALQNDIIRPSVTPAVFELREPNNDIYGRVI